MTNSGHGDGKVVALVVPSLTRGGGVPAVARFLCRVLEDSDRYEPRLVSLAMSSRDQASVRILDPRSWLRGVRRYEGEWEGRPFIHVGARLVELEFMRYAPRSALSDLLDRADLVQVVAGAPCWALPTVRTRTPVFLQVATLTRRERETRNRIESGPAALWRRVMSRLTDRLDRIGLRAADRVFVENRWMEQRAEAEASGDRVVFAPPGVDVDHFHPRDAADNTASSDCYILSVARFGDPRKNAGLLIRAYARLRGRIPAAPQLWLAGPSGPPAGAWTLARECGVEEKVRYLGEVSRRRLSRLYREALFFVLSSDEEGFGLVVAEAMASGIPVVSTACGGPSEIITHEEDGLLAPVGDAARLADAMERLVRNFRLRRRMAERARLTAVRRYSLEARGRRFLEEYDAELVDPRQGPVSPGDGRRP